MPWNTLLHQTRNHKIRVTKEAAQEAKLEKNRVARKKLVEKKKGNKAAGTKKHVEEAFG